jgi:hypothetical protein
MLLKLRLAGVQRLISGRRLRCSPSLALGTRVGIDCRIILALGAALALGATAAQAATATGTASVSIDQKPLSVTETGEGLNFGAVTPTGAGDDIPSPDDGQDAFTIAGQPYAVVNVSVPDSTQLSGPGSALTVNSFFANGDLDDSNNMTLDVDGQAVFTVRATLHIPTGATPPGTYTGGYAVTVNYQ